MSTKKEAVRFEDKLETLEALVAKMEEGKMSLDELLLTYEQGIRLADGLKKDLETAQTRLSELKEGVVRPVEEA